MIQLTGLYSSYLQVTEVFRGVELVVSNFEEQSYYLCQRPSRSIIRTMLKGITV
jgi:hypothetical protein